jgi:phage terminase large subunit GpA-like protein
MKEVKKSDACWHIHLYVDCPHCDARYDLMNEDEWWVSFGSPWEDKEKVNEKFQCESCKKDFIIENVNY